MVIAEPVNVETQRVSQDLSEGKTLPSSWYTQPSVYALERATIFRRTWQYVGMTEMVACVGDFVTCSLGDVPIIVVRDDNGELRGHVNVCRHRGSQVVLKEHGSCKSLQCHYHAWTYGLDGTLRAAPAAREQDHFDPAQFSLFPVRVETWGPFIFANPDMGAESLMEYLGELPELVAETGIHLDGLKCRDRKDYETAANWKVVVENYLECYHCPVAHPSFSDLIDVNDYTVRKYGNFSTQGGPLRQSAKSGRKHVYTIGEGVESGFYVFLWPNFMLNIYPGPGNVSINLILPGEANHSLAKYEFCFVDEVGERDAAEFVRFIDQVQDEDITLCESVQRGLATGYLDHGTLMLSREQALQHFERMVFDAVTSV